MSERISGVVVRKISLLTGDNDPAVPMADSKFAIYKNIQKRVGKKEDVNKLEEGDYLDCALNSVDDKVMGIRIGLIRKKAEKVMEKLW